MARRESLYFDVLTSLPVLVVNLVLLGMVVAGLFFGRHSLSIVGITTTTPCLVPVFFLHKEGA